MVLVLCLLPHRSKPALLHLTFCMLLFFLLTLLCFRQSRRPFATSELDFLALPLPRVLVRFCVIEWSSKLSSSTSPSEGGGLFFFLGLGLLFLSSFLFFLAVHTFCDVWYSQPPCDTKDFPQSGHFIPLIPLARIMFLPTASLPIAEFGRTGAPINGELTNLPISFLRTPPRFESPPAMSEANREKD